LVDVSAGFLDDQFESSANKLGLGPPFDLGKRDTQSVDVGTFDSALKGLAARADFVIGTPASVLRWCLCLSGKEVTYGVGFVDDGGEVSVGLVDHVLKGVLNQFGVGPSLGALNGEQSFGGDSIDASLNVLAAFGALNKFHCSRINLAPPRHKSRKGIK
jgi:hypothetical protein